VDDTTRVPVLHSIKEEYTPPIPSPRHLVQIRSLDEDLPEAVVPYVEREDDYCACHHPGDYAMAELLDVPLMNEAARALLASWPYPLQITLMLQDCGGEDLSPCWEILGPDCGAIEEIMVGWVTFRREVSNDASDLAERVKQTFAMLPASIQHALTDEARRRPARTTIQLYPKRHAKLHRIADAHNGWTCHYCGIGLIDVCSDRDMLYDERGGRYIDPSCGKKPPTLDHVVPQALGGSHCEDNLVLACQPCNARKNCS
jgi:5-methylcytosine-specific restriction endonuclease McrA